MSAGLIFLTVAGVYVLGSVLLAAGWTLARRAGSDGPE
jgi:hypothetical protein